uniref:Uncharacterized protein n=1 Tax=Oryza meridionalis TaxID=40149 RepID=A0A0E0FB76_9ORYZ
MAGIVKMPWIQLGVEVKGPCIILVGVNTDFSWEIKYERRWIDMMKDSISTFGFCHSMQLRSGLQPERLTERRLVRPIGVADGRFVYIGVRQEWKTKDKILCYNMVTGKTYDTGKEVGHRYSKNTFYVYCNSMANIPHIAVPAQGKICEGSTGGCICAMYTGEDIATDMAGIVKMPWIQLGVECIILVGVNTDFSWEIKYERRWIDMMKDSISTFGFCHSMQLRSGLQPERLTERRLVRPIGVADGRFVYIGVRQEWKTKDKILCYNMVTGKTYDTAWLIFHTLRCQLKGKFVKGVLVVAYVQCTPVKGMRVVGSMPWRRMYDAVKTGETIGERMWDVAWASHVRASIGMWEWSMAPRRLEKTLHSDIRIDVTRCNILPQLPFKLATRFKVISKKNYGILTNNTPLSARQARLCPPCPALIHMDLPDRHLGAYTTNVEAIDLLSSMPDIAFDFLGCCLENGILSLLASTISLVYILYTPIYFISHSRAPILFIANLAMQKSQLILGTAKHIARFNKGIGLAFDPVAYGSGIMYWDYQEIVLWFDIATDMAGITKMPRIQLGVEVKGPVNHDIDTSDKHQLQLGDQASEKMDLHDKGEHLCIWVLPFNAIALRIADKPY